GQVALALKLLRDPELLVVGELGSCCVANGTGDLPSKILAEGVVVCVAGLSCSRDALLDHLNGTRGVSFLQERAGTQKAAHSAQSVVIETLGEDPELVCKAPSILNVTLHQGRQTRPVDALRE